MFLTAGHQILLSTFARGGPYRMFLTAGHQISAEYLLCLWSLCRMFLRISLQVTKFLLNTLVGEVLCGVFLTTFTEYGYQYILTCRPPLRGNWGNWHDPEAIVLRSLNGSNGHNQGPRPHRFLPLVFDRWSR